MMSWVKYLCWNKSSENSLLAKDLRMPSDYTNILNSQEREDVLRGQSRGSQQPKLWAKAAGLGNVRTWVYQPVRTRDEISGLWWMGS